MAEHLLERGRSRVTDLGFGGRQCEVLGRQWETFPLLPRKG